MRSFFFITILVIAACAHPTTISDDLRERLTNRGRVPLELENPFVATTIFLSKEMEKSAEFKGFISERGDPNSIELKESFWNPLTMILYYEKDHQFYSLEKVNNTWVIHGPFEDQKELNKGNEAKNEETQLIEEKVDAAALAEQRKKSGDIIYNVKSRVDTLETISVKLTHDQGNAEKIARINRIPKDKPLVIGQEILVPGYLMKQGNR